jgi:hypothetical protein
MRKQLLTTTAAVPVPDGPTVSPAPPDLSTLPLNVDRRHGAELVTRYFFPVSYRTLERWPLVGRVVNGRLVFPTAELFAHARALMDAAPPIRGGKRAAKICNAA